MPLRTAVDATPITANETYYRRWGGGRGVIRTNGSFGGGTVTLSVLSPDGTNYDSLGTDTVFTSDGSGQFYLDGGSRIAIILTGATSPEIYTVLAEVD